MIGNIKLYVLLSSIFCVVIVAGNLIFQKFIVLNIFNFSFQISVGILFYPITFLISDLITEFYGRSGGILTVRIAILCTVIVLCLIQIANFLPASDWSKIDDKTFNRVFGAFEIGAGASLISSYLGQATDIYVFSYIKKLTKGKYLWIRSNISTILGQFVDSFIVVSILYIFNLIEFENSRVIIYSSIIFKIFATILSTPVYYLAYSFIRKYESDSTTKSSEI